MTKRILLFALTICLLTGCQNEPEITTQLLATTEETVQVSTVEPVKDEANHELTEPETSQEITESVVLATVETTAVADTTPPTEEATVLTTESAAEEAIPDTTEPPIDTECLPEVWEDTTEPVDETVPIEEVTQPTETAETTVKGLDCEAVMSAGNQYGVDTYGWIADSSLNESNAGFNFGSWVFAEQGQAALEAAGIGQIDFLYNSMKAAYTDMEITGIRFRVHAFECEEGLYEVRVYYA
jgi:hypothetical protein